MPRKARQSKRAYANKLAQQSISPVAICKSSIWSPQETVGAHFQWAQMCATGVDTALNYLQSIEPGTLEVDSIYRGADINIRTHIPSSNASQSTHIYIASHEDLPLVAAQNGRS